MGHSKGTGKQSADRAHEAVKVLNLKTIRMTPGDGMTQRYKVTIQVVAEGTDDLALSYHTSWDTSERVQPRVDSIIRECVAPLLKDFDKGR